MTKKKHKKNKSTDSLEKIAWLGFATAGMVPLTELLKIIGKLIDKLLK